VRVVHVVPSLATRTGGPAYAVAELCRALVGVGVGAQVFATDQAGPAQLGGRSAGIPLQLPAAASEIDLCLFPVTRLPRLAYAAGLREALTGAAREADLIHIHSLFLYPSYAAYQAARATNTPYIVSPHGSLDPYIRRNGRLRKAATHAAWQARLFRHAAAIHATTPEEADLWPAYARRRPVVIIPNGITLADYTSLPDGAPFRHQFGIGADDPLVINIGRITAKKNLDTLVRAVARLHHQHGLHAHLALVGPDDENLTPQLTATAQHELIPGYVHFTGHLEGTHKLEALAAANAFALPSHSENFGIAVLEALAAGTPTLISPHVNLAPQLQKANAALIEPSNPQATAHGLHQLLTNTQLSHQLTTNGKTFAATHDWQTIATTMTANYERIIGRPRSPAGERSYPVDSHA